MASKRIPLVAGNWKMNFDHLEATYFVQKLVWLLRDAHFDFKRCEVALFPSFTSLRSVQVLVEADKLHVAYGAIRFRDHPRCLHRRCVRGHDRPSWLLIRHRRPLRTPQIPS